MVCGGRSQTNSNSNMAAAVALAAGAVALSLFAQPVAATPECIPMDLVTHNISDYIRWSGTSDRL